MRAFVLAGGAAVAFLSSQAAQSKPVFSLTTGVTYSEGDYGGDEKFRTTTIPLTARVRTGPFRFSARMPYLFRDGPMVVSDEAGPLGPSSGARDRRNGFGDLTLAMVYSLPRKVAGIEVDLGTFVKLPTASTRKNLGSGETDFGFSADLSAPGGKITPFLNLGYRIRGDRESLPLRNTINASVGAAVPVGKAVATLAYDYSRASSRFRSDSHSLFGSVGGRISRRFSITGYGSTGLSKGAADLGAGILLTARSR